MARLGMPAAEMGSHRVGAPAEAWKAGPKNPSFGKSQGQGSHRGAGPAMGHKDVNVTSSRAL